MRHAAAVVLSAGLLSACGSDREAREVDRMLSRVTIAVDVAKSQEVKRYAASELGVAEEKLARAQRAARQKEYEEADRLISESLVNLNLATAKADAARVRGEVDRLKEKRTGAPKDRAY
jgi:hypothetical protein